MAKNSPPRKPKHEIERVVGLDGADRRANTRVNAIQLSVGEDRLLRPTFSRSLSRSSLSRLPAARKVFISFPVQVGTSVIVALSLLSGKWRIIGL
jgi:hypothetical protein